MPTSADEIVAQKIIEIAKQDGVFLEGKSIEQLLEAIRIKRRQRGKNLNSNSPIGESKRMAKKRQEQEKLAIGRWVRWSPQGSPNQLEGEILAYVPRGTEVPLEGLDISVRSRLNFNPAWKTQYDRYLVAVRTKRTTRYSTPRVSSVSIVD